MLGLPCRRLSSASLSVTSRRPSISIIRWLIHTSATKASTSELQQHHLSGPVDIQDPFWATTKTNTKQDRRSIIQARLNKHDSIAPFSSPFLRDRFSRQHTYLRVSLTQRCNLRCMYCMPIEGVPLLPKQDELTDGEVVRLIKLFVSQGVNKIRFTGGEPTLRKGLDGILAAISPLREVNGGGLKQIGITTNGITLTKQLNTLAQLGLTQINISLDTLDPFKFEIMTRRPSAGLQKVLDGIDLALSLGIPSVKINVVIMRGVNDTEDVLQFVEWAKHRNVVIRFIEYMPFDGNKWRIEKLVPYKELMQVIQSKYGDLQRIGDDENDTTKHWKVPGHMGSLGFISSMTEHFCGTCNRLRITADGNIKVCLFGGEEVSLRDALRQGLPEHGISTAATDQQLLGIIGSAVGRKHARHGGVKSLEELATSENRSMIRIGG